MENFTVLYAFNEVDKHVALQYGSATWLTVHEQVFSL
jgi:hypothetical protein